MAINLCRSARGRLSLNNDIPTVIIPENRSPVRPLHTAEYGFARFATLMVPTNPHLRSSIT